jgi:hypothetical protein
MKGEPTSMKQTSKLGTRRTRSAITTLSMLGVLTALTAGPSGAADQPSLKAVPRANCGPGSMPETDSQGRVPAADYASGRAAKGYTCNTRQISHVVSTAGFKVFRYTDRAGHTCAYYDSTQFFPTDVYANLTHDGLGVFVLDMTNPAKPKKTANLTTPAMLTPHESLQLNQKRGLLVAVAGNAVTEPGVVDVYDVTQDCRTPQLQSSTPFGVLGHESAMSPDGLTFYASSTYGTVIAAIDLTNPKVPLLLWAQPGTIYHGMGVSDDGKRLYAANDSVSNLSLDILDVSQIQSRALAPRVSTISNLNWPTVSIPQVPVPFSVNRHPYLLEVDEFNKPTGEVGAARIIDVADDAHPFVASNIRLEVHQPANRTGTDQQTDPGAPESPYGGYTAHYCSVPRRTDPGLAACSFIGSGLRIFDIRDPKHPREVGYFNKPSSKGSHAMSAPAWDPTGGQVWYSDSNSGFYAVQLTNGIANVLRAPARSTTGAAPPHAAPPPAPADASAGTLPTTGPPLGIPLIAVLSLGVAVVMRHSVIARRELAPPRS